MKIILTKSLFVCLLLLTNMIFAQSFTNFSVISTGNNLLDNNIQSIAIDQSGNKWIGTNYGISVFNSTDAWINNYTSIDNLPTDNDFIKDIDVDSHGSIWIGNFVSYLFKGSITKYDGTNWTTYPYDTLPGGAPVGLVNPNIFRMAVDQNDNLWVATGGGISKFNYLTSTFTNYTEATSGLNRNVVQCVAIDNNNNKWFGTDQGVVKFDDVSWTVFTNLGLLNNDININSIAVDNNNNIWVGSSDYGVSKYDGTNWTSYTTADGLVSNGINYISCNSDGSVWFATYQGVSVLRNSIWTTYTTANGLPNDCVYHLIPESLTHMWIGTVCDGGFSNFDYTTSVNNQITENTAITIFPNPTKDYLNITLPKSKCNYTNKVEFYNVIGEKICEYSLSKEKNALKIPLHNFSNGVYFVQIGNFCEKVIIQK